MHEECDWKRRVCARAKAFWNDEYGKIAVVAVCLVTIFWCFNLIFVDSTGGGTFGDKFGAVNAWFSGLAFAGVIVTLLMQRQELEDNRKELKKTADAQQDAAKLSALTTLISEYNRVIDRNDEALHSQRNPAIGDVRTRVSKENEVLRSLKQQCIKEIENLLKYSGFELKGLDTL